MDQMALGRMERHHVQLALVPVRAAATDENVLPDEVAVELVPLGDELFEEVHLQALQLVQKRDEIPAREVIRVEAELGPPRGNGSCGRVILSRRV